MSKINWVDFGGELVIVMGGHGGGGGGCNADGDAIDWMEGIDLGLVVTGVVTVEMKPGWTPFNCMSSYNLMVVFCPQLTQDTFKVSGLWTTLRLRRLRCALYLRHGKSADVVESAGHEGVMDVSAHIWLFIISHSICEFSYETCVLQFCLVQKGVGIIQAVKDGMNCVHTVAVYVSMTIVFAFGLLSVGTSFKKFKNAYHKWLTNVLLACACCVHISRQRKFPLSGLLYLSLWLSPVVGSGSPVATGSCQGLDQEKFSNLFLAALDKLDKRVGDEVDNIFDEIGLGPFGTSLSVGDIYNFRAGLFEKLFGTNEERTAWINNTTSPTIDIRAKLNENIANDIGIDRLNVTCVLLNDTYMFDLTVHGSISSVDFIDPQVTLLPPASFPRLGLNVSTLGARYELTLPFTLYHGVNKIAHLGETQAKLSLQLNASISEILPILLNKNITFNGVFNLNAIYSYSSIQGTSSFGSFSADLETDVADLAGKKVALKAQDDNIFDDNPRE